MLSPCLIVALYDGKSPRSALEKGKADIVALLECAAPGDLAVMLHTTPDPTDVVVAEEVRALGVERILLGAPANPLVRTARDRGVTRAVGVVNDWIGVALQMRAEVLMPNGERDSKNPTGDWVVNTERDKHLLPELARGIMEAIASTPDLLAGWTSHDRPDYHALPWGDVLAHCSVHSPQQYIDDPGTPGLDGLGAAKARAANAERTWGKLRDRDAIPRVVAPGGDGWAPYVQLHGAKKEATVYLSDRSHCAVGWALGGRRDDEGVLAWKALLRARAEVGPGPGALARFQARHGLAADGVLGPRSLSALGLD